MPRIAVFAFSSVIALTLAAGPVSAGDTPAYQGSRSCKKCHFKQYKTWAKTSMALSFENLKAGAAAEAKTAAGLDANTDYTTDTSCLPCHTTGYGQPGGFTSLEDTPDLAGVGCESCHGPGESYLEIKDVKKKDHPISSMIERGLIYPATESQCMQCHNDTSPFFAGAFNFAEAVRDEGGTHAHTKLKGNHPDMAELGTIFQ